MFNVGFVHGESLWTSPVADSKCLPTSVAEVSQRCIMSEKTLIYIITTMIT